MTGDVYHAILRLVEIKSESEVSGLLNMSDILRGYTDTIILAQLQEKDSYGYEINKNVQELTAGMLELKEATLYTSFRRMETSGYIVSYWGDESVGARRRYYALTESGKALFRENLADWKKAKEIIEKLIER